MELSLAEMLAVFIVSLIIEEMVHIINPHVVMHFYLEDEEDINPSTIFNFVELVQHNASI